MKRRFEFRLKRLARVREVLERTARAEWSRAEAEALAAENVWTAGARRRETAQRDLAEGLAGGRIDPRSVLRAQDAIDGLANHEHGLGEAARTRRWQADQLRDAWRERERDRKALDKLAERDLRRHRAAVERADQAELDEVASTRHAREARVSPSRSSTPSTDLRDRESPSHPR